jgi:hypothetical protein
MGNFFIIYERKLGNPAQCTAQVYSSGYQWQLEDGMLSGHLMSSAFTRRWPFFYYILFLNNKHHMLALDLRELNHSARLHLLVYYLKTDR